MKKISLFFLVSSMWFYGNCFAQQDVSFDGYLTTIYGKIVKDIYGECVHTAYFDKEANANKECAEQSNSI